MGVYGTGNFDNDDAMDFLIELHDSLAEKMTFCIASPEDTAGDETTRDDFMASLEVLCLLCENTPAGAPSPLLVMQCRAAFLDAWDALPDAEHPFTVFEQERRVVFEATFARLLRVAQAQMDAHAD